jgi:hypothetical protein
MERRRFSAVSYLHLFLSLYNQQSVIRRYFCYFSPTLSFLFDQLIRFWGESATGIIFNKKKLMSTNWYPIIVFPKSSLLYKIINSIIFECGWFVILFCIISILYYFLSSKNETSRVNLISIHSEFSIQLSLIIDCRISRFLSQRKNIQIFCSIFTSEKAIESLRWNLKT